MASVAQHMYHLKGETEHVRHGQHTYRSVSVVAVGYIVQGEAYIRPYIAVGEHDALGEAHRAAGVVEYRHGIDIFGLHILHVCRREALGILLAEETIEIGASLAQPLAPRHQQGIVGDIDCASQLLQGIRVEVLPYRGIDKEQLGIGVIDQVMHVVWLEFVQNGHCHCTIGENTEECHAPMGAIAPAQCDFVASLDAGVLKEQMQLGYLASNGSILE